jgi:hypothetical protein
MNARDVLLKLEAVIITPFVPHAVSISYSFSHSANTTILNYYGRSASLLFTKQREMASKRAYFAERAQCEEPNRRDKQLKHLNAL